MAPLREHGGRATACPDRPRRPVRNGAAAGPHRRPGDREHRHQRMRPRVGDIRRRLQAADAANRRFRPGACRPDSVGGQSVRALRAAFRPGPSRARPAPAGWQPAIGLDGGDGSGRPCRSGGTASPTSRLPISADLGTLDADLASLLARRREGRKNIVVSGAMNSGRRLCSGPSPPRSRPGSGSSPSSRHSSSVLTLSRTGIRTWWRSRPARPMSKVSA